MLIFDLDADGPLGRALAADLDLELAPHEQRRFEDGECKLRPLADPRGDDVYVVHSLHGGPRESPHDKLFALLSFIATLRDHGAARVTAVVPYLAYGRKDRRTKPFDPVTQRYVAQLLEAVGMSQLVVLEAHNPAALENAFRARSSTWDPDCVRRRGGALSRAPGRGLARPAASSARSCGASASMRSSPCLRLRAGRQAAQRRRGQRHGAGGWRRAGRDRAAA
jgi:hypothetical protein